MLKIIKKCVVTTMLGAILTSSALAASSGAAKVTADALNMRTAPNTESRILATVPNGTDVVVAGHDESTNWYKVVYRGSVGYMSGDYLDYKTTMDGNFGNGLIHGNGVRMRTQPNLEGDILGYYNTGTKMQVLGVSDAWYKVKVNETIGYVHSDYFALNGGISELHLNGGAPNEAKPAPSVPEANNSEAGQKIVDTAMKYLGVPYVWGGTSPKGFDCSGLVYYVYKENGYTINRTAASIYQNGRYVDKSELQPGDAICFANSSQSIGHVGIYIGNGQMIHASSSQGKIAIANLSQSYFTRNYVGARRIV